MRRGVLIFLISLGWALVSQSAGATLITFSFTGTVTTAGGIWTGQGSTVTGFYSFDTDLIDQDSSAELDFYRADQPLANQGLLWEISVTVGSVTRTTADNQNLDDEAHHILEWADSSTEDRFRIESNPIIASDDYARIQLIDSSPSPPDGVAVGTGNLTDTPITTAPNVSLFDTVAGESFYDAYDGAGASEGLLEFTVTDISLIPEPASASLLLAGLVGLAARRRFA